MKMAKMERSLRSHGLTDAATNGGHRQGAAHGAAQLLRHRDSHLDLVSVHKLLDLVYSAGLLRRPACFCVALDAGSLFGLLRLGCSALGLFLFRRSCCVCAALRQLRFGWHSGRQPSESFGCVPSGRIGSAGVVGGRAVRCSAAGFSRPPGWARLGAAAGARLPCVWARLLVEASVRVLGNEVFWRLTPISRSPRSAAPGPGRLGH